MSPDAEEHHDRSCVKTKASNVFFEETIRYSKIADVIVRLRPPEGIGYGFRINLSGERVKAKILYVIDNIEFGGGERVLAQLAEALRDRYEISFACEPGGSLGERLRRMGVRIHPLDFRRQVSLARIACLMTIIKEEGIHLVHSMGARADFSARIAGRLAGAPVIVSTIAMLVEGYDVSSLKRAVYRVGDRMSERLCDGFIAVSAAISKILVENHRIPEEKVVTIHNSGVELNIVEHGSHDELALRRELGLDPKGPIVGTIGRLVYQKAQHVFLHAAAHVVQAVPNAQFLIVGEGPLRPDLDRLSRELDLQTCRFLGFRQDIPRILSLMDVFALSSILEGFPQVLLEAMAAARPVVATQIDGVTEVVQHDVTGLLVPPQEPVALASAITSLLQDQGMAHRLAKAGRKLVEERFAVSRIVAEVDQFYSTLLKQNGIR